MDWVALCERGMELLKKYRYVLLVLLAGIFLMALPSGGEKKEAAQETIPAETQAEPDLQDSLAEILSQIDGAGKVRVLLTQSAGAQTVYQTDEDISDSSVQSDTVVISDSDRVQTGLIRQVNPPTYLGAIVLCQGADKAAIRLAIVEAVANATGLSTNKISVLKMK